MSEPLRRSFDLHFENEDQEHMAAVLLHAYQAYCARDKLRGGVWRRSGLRGMAHECLAKAERGFSQVMGGSLVERDHYLDLIIYSAMASIQLADNNLNGEWPWPG
jgi:hypothetical protein